MTWMSQIAAKTIVQDRCQYLVTPVLASTDIDNVLARTQRASLWTGVTAYDFNARIVPTVRNGLYFRCMMAGTSGATQPIWPAIYGSSSFLYNYPFRRDYSDQPFPDPAALRGIIITDGTVQWQAVYPDWNNIYDLDAATFEVWMLKAALASQMIDAAIDNQKLSFEQTYQHCFQMAQRYAPLIVG